MLDTWMRRVGAGLLLAFACSVHSGEAQGGDPGRPYVSKISHYTYDVDKDGRATTDVTRRYLVLQDSGIESLKTFSFSYSTSIETGEVLEAYTLKKDGRKIPVPADNYQHQTNQGRRGANPFFSDRTSYSVVFPDLAVGDAVHVHYRTTEKEPIFPGHFSEQHRFSPYEVQEDVLVTVRAPKDLPLRQVSNQVRFTERTEGDRRVMEWRYSNKTPRVPDEDTDGGIWSLSEYPNLFVSTFASYEAISQAYGARALPKAVPTARIRELATTVIGAETDPKQKARKLYEWVSRNITYGGNCIGVGAVVPRDLDVVLDNRMGDCKDHATLLQALLAAASIRSEQVLINAGSDYELPQVPVVSMVNHVMNYLPDWDLYVDATAKEIPFGYLPEGSYSKHVLHVGREKALAQIPGSDHSSNRQQLEMTLKIADNGSATGTMRVKAHGTQAAAMRAYMRELRGQNERDFVKGVLASSGYRGRGTVDRGNVDGLGDEYAFAVTFEIDNYIKTRSGVLYFAPVVSTPMPVMNFAGFEEKPAPRRPQVCHGFHSAEKIDVELPANLELLTFPADAKFSGRYVDFDATYKRAGTHVTIARALDDKTPGNVCSPEMFAEFMRQAIPVGDHLRTETLFKRK